MNRLIVILLLTMQVLFIWRGAGAGAGPTPSAPSPSPSPSPTVTPIWLSYNEEKVASGKPRLYFGGWSVPPTEAVVPEGFMLIEVFAGSQSENLWLCDEMSYPIDLCHTTLGGVTYLRARCLKFITREPDLCCAYDFSCAEAIERYR